MSQPKPPHKQPPQHNDQSHSEQSGSDRSDNDRHPSAQSLSEQGVEKTPPRRSAQRSRALPGQGVPSYPEVTGRSRWILPGSIILISLFFVIITGAIMSQRPKAKLIEGPAEHAEIAQRCEVVLSLFNRDELDGQINVNELTEIVRSLRDEYRLPTKFLTKAEAADFGWRPGVPFNRIADLRGRALGGDHFGNYEGRLPTSRYREADLDYLGQRRNAKRLVYNASGQYYVTIDHYESFKKVPACD